MALDKKKLSESDVCDKFIRPAMEQAGWHRSDQTKQAALHTTAVQINESRAYKHKVIPLKLSPQAEIEVKDGDISIARAGPMNRVGVSCWVSKTPPRLMLSDRIVRFHPIADETLLAFLISALSAGWTKTQAEEAKTGMAASQVNISKKRSSCLLVTGVQRGRAILLRHPRSLPARPVHRRAPASHQQLHPAGIG